MYLKLLAVDKEPQRFEKQYDLWLKNRIMLVRTCSMQEAIARLSHEEFVIAAINADNINYLPQLKIMRDVTAIPIHILTSDYTYEKELEALNLGANEYRPWCKEIENNTARILIVLQRHAQENRKIPLNFITHNEVSVYPDYRKAFVNDKELELTKMEFDILYMLIENHKRVFTYEQIYNRIWGYEYIENGNNALFNEMKRLRKKLKESAGLPNYIRNVHNLGYTFD